MQTKDLKRTTVESKEKLTFFVAHFFRAWKRKCLVFVSNNNSETKSKPANHRMAGSSAEQTWQQFCERHAKAAALDFSKATLSFTHRMPQSANVTHRDFMKLYVENFEKSFESDFLRRRQQKVCWHPF